MKATSFGEKSVIVERDEKPLVEHLKFKREGRSHKHLEFESFFVLSGKGTVYVGEKEIFVEEGSLVVIPPKTSHWMKPNSDSVLEGLLWYHEAPLSLVS